MQAHVITGGFPPGKPAGHDMDYARLRLLQFLHEDPAIRSTMANDFTDIAKWLPHSQLLITYVAGPYPDDEQNQYLRQWIEAGGRWLALHGTSGGKATRVGETRQARKMVKTSHHDTLGSFFLNHPPLRKFQVHVTDPTHAITRDLPASFEVTDELYLIELQTPPTPRVLLTTELATDPSPPGFGFVYDDDTALQADGKTRVLGYTRDLGQGSVAYIALGHCYPPAAKRPSLVNASVNTSHDQANLSRGPWETDAFQTLLRNAIQWGLGRN
jgi:type 1 glutamine amidotransferase